MTTQKFAATVGMILMAAAITVGSYGNWHREDNPSLAEQTEDTAIVLGLASLLSFSFYRNNDSFES